MGTLLIAGPLALDDLTLADGTEHRALIGGVGGYAAIAAAPLAPTQLWCRGGSDVTAQMKSLLSQRHIDLAGVDWSGPTPRGRPTGFEPGGMLLPDIEPTSSDGLGGVLLIGLPPGEMLRALRVVAALPGSEERSLVVSPRPADLSDVHYRRDLLAVTTVLVLPAAKAQALTGEATPLAAAQAFQADGAKAVVLTASQLGGLISYQGKATTYPALPLPALDKSGISAAFPGAVAAWIAGTGRCDFATLKRACAMASGVGGLCAQGIGPKRLLQANRDEYMDRFNRLRRDQKY